MWNLEKQYPLNQQEDEDFIESTLTQHYTIPTLSKVIEAEKMHYKQAIKNNEKFSDVKLIYLRIKKYNILMDVMLQNELS